MLVVVANSKDVGQNDMAPYSRSIPSSKHQHTEHFHRVKKRSTILSLPGDENTPETLVHPQWDVTKARHHSTDLYKVLED